MKNSSGDKEIIYFSCKGLKNIFCPSLIFTVTACCRIIFIFWLELGPLMNLQHCLVSPALVQIVLPTNYRSSSVFGRKGTLFMRPFKRLLIKDDHYLTKVVHYIHANPVQHGYCKSIPDWRHSSYKRILYNQSSGLQREEVLSWFGGVLAYKIFHGQTILVKFKVWR